VNKHHVLQLASSTELDVHKESVAALKKLCRQRTMATWKGWRAEMEAQRAETLHVRNALQSVLCLMRMTQKLIRLLSGSIIAG
jgi:hypothetical protein